MALTDKRIKELTAMKICTSCDHLSEAKSCKLYPGVEFGGSWPVHCPKYSRIKGLKALKKEEIEWIHESAKTIKTPDSYKEKRAKE